MEYWHVWIWAVGLVAVGALAGIAAHLVLFATLRRVAARSGTTLDDAFVRHAARPARLLLASLGAIILLGSAATLPGTVVAPLRHFITLVFIGASAWIAIALTAVLDDVVAARYRTDVANNLRARRIRTQAQVLRRVAVSIVIVLALGVMLMTFPAVRQLGISLFASAGAAGIVLGIAARPALGNLIAGLQLAFTEPIRLDDVVIIDGEYGRVEEITATYVVVALWDERRLIVPLSYFIENRFQNWTRTTAQLLGTVYLYTDYTVPVDELRGELQRILENTPLWDQRVWGLQVTDATERTLQLRALVSARDSSGAWDLRCHVRERLLAFLQEHHPDSLPRLRVADAAAASDGRPPSPGAATPPVGHAERARPDAAGA